MDMAVKRHHPAMGAKGEIADRKCASVWTCKWMAIFYYQFTASDCHLTTDVFVVVSEWCDDTKNTALDGWRWMFSLLSSSWFCLLVFMGDVAIIPISIMHEEDIWQIISLLSQVTNQREREALKRDEISVHCIGLQMNERRPKLHWLGFDWLVDWWGIVKGLNFPKLWNEGIDRSLLGEWPNPSD